MNDPGLALQRALVAALTVDPALAALVDGRVYDQPPADAPYPYVTIGEDQVLPEEGDGYDGSDTTLTLHVWSQAVGFPQAKAIMAAIRAALRAGLPVEGGTRLVDLVFDSARTLRDPDGVTSHGVLTFTALTEPS